MAASSPSRWRALLLDYLGMLLVLGLLILFFSTTTRNFWSASNFSTIANQVPVAIVLAVGMTFVLIVGGIDLSVGSVLALAGAVAGVCLVKWNLGVPVALLAALLVGLACGAVNGLIVTVGRIPSFIVTLGMLEMARGGAALVLDQRKEFLYGALDWVRAPVLFGLTPAFLAAIMIAVVGQLILTRTVFGRYMIAVGTNEEVVRLAGINPKPIKLAVFALCGLLAGVAAIFHCADIGLADPTAASAFELQAIAAVVIGGTSLMGGRGSVLNSLLGVVIIAVLQTGLVQVGASDPMKRVITGGVIVVAVLLDRYRQAGTAS
ncbi:MAG: ABC transporter permease [Gemmataceae bacterium]